jgi:phosphatidate cytidylyltransferase
VALSNLATRIISAVVLAPIAIAATWLGGIYFAIFFAVAAAAVFWEWIGLVSAARNRMIWIAAGFCYAGIMFLAPVSLRGDLQFGIPAIIFIFVVVWSTDILAYFVGRAIGGPKLAPSISPNKTWSGAVAGTISAVVIATITMVVLIGSLRPGLIATSLLLSIASQIGDLAESALKRKFGAKDAGHLIPGHGGVMDRLDGFWAASLLALIIGVARAGFEAPARGLLLW